MSFGANTYSYDANGNISSKVDGSLTLTQYVYDSDGTLAAVNMPGKTIWYGTDNEGRRIEKKVNGVKVENYIWDGLLRLVAVTNSSGVIQKRFIYSDGHAPDYMVDAQGATYLFVKDHRGSVVAVINSNTGQVVQSLSYTEWGAIVSDSNPGFQPFGFAGGLYDRDTKLLRFGVRSYDSEIGRWTSKDPILFDGGDTNIYGYTFGDPLNYTDPDGRCPLCVAIAIGGVVGASANLIGSYVTGNLNIDNALQTAATGFATGAVTVASSGASIAAAGVTSFSQLFAVNVGSSAFSSAMAGLVTDIGLNILFSGPPQGVTSGDVSKAFGKKDCP